MSNSIHVETIGQLNDGRDIQAFTLENSHGMRATFLNYGGLLVELEVPDRIGITDDVTLGLDDIESYVSGNKPYFGAIVGRFANRIANASFTIDDKEYALTRNSEEEPFQLHGGPVGFSHSLMDAAVEEGKTGEVLHFSLTSPDGDMGFPGELKFSVRIWLTEQNGLCFEYQATTDAPTHVNFTTHPYFNLAGQDSGSIRQHLVSIDAEHFLPMDEHSLPTGKLESVNDGPFDFRELQSLDQRLDSPNAQVALEGGFDHNFVLRKDRDCKKDPVAVVIDEGSGRKLEVFTTEPGIQFYTANFMDGTLAGKNDVFYQKHSGFCLETQHFPDSPNQPQFPSTLLKPGKAFKSFTEYRFSSVKD